MKEASSTYLEIRNEYKNVGQIIKWWILS